MEPEVNLIKPTEATPIPEMPKEKDITHVSDFLSPVGVEIAEKHSIVGIRMEDKPADKVEDDIVVAFEITGSTTNLVYAGSSYDIKNFDLDKIFCAYSRKGLNLSGPTIRAMLGVDEALFRALTAKLGLSKECEPFCPATLETMEASALYVYLEDLVSEVLDVYIKNDGTVATQITKTYKEAIVKYQNQDLYIRSQMESLKHSLPKVGVRPMKSVPMKISNISHLVIPDMHIGIQQPNYNKDIVREKLAEILEFVRYEPNLHVHFMGDIIHTVSGMNHPDNWKSIGPDDYGSNAITNPYEILLDFLSAIPGLTKVTMVGGNHDRMAADKKMENDAEAGKLLAYFLNISLVGIPVIFNSSMIIDNDDPNLVMINLHGVNPIDKESGQRIAWEFGDKSKFTYINTAHLHRRKVDPKDDNLKFRKVQLQAFCPIDKYGKTVAHPSLAGVVLIESTTLNKLPIVTDYPLHYDA